MSADAKAAILARRARFVAAAMAGLAAAACGKKTVDAADASPREVLRDDQIPPRYPPPKTCLSTTLDDPPEPEGDAAAEAEAARERLLDAQARPCLRVVRADAGPRRPCDPHDPLCLADEPHGAGAADAGRTPTGRSGR